MSPPRLRANARQSSRASLDSLSIRGSDLAWYGTAVLLTVGGFVVQLALPGAREAGLGVLFVVLGIGLGTVRTLLQRFADLADRLDLNMPAFPEDRQSSPMVKTLWDSEITSHRDRLEALRDGLVTITTQDAALDHFMLLTQTAQSTLTAVDHIALTQWVANPRLTACLNLQMTLAKEGRLRVERIRFVNQEHLEDPSERNLLRWFITTHEQAGARLLLCPERRGRELDTVFFPRTGLILTDAAARPSCLLPRLSDVGYLESAVIHLRANSTVRSVISDYKRVKTEIERQSLDQAVRAELARHQDAATTPPASDERLADLPLGNPTPEGGAGR